MKIGERVAQLSGLASGNLFEHLRSISDVRVYGPVEGVARVDNSVSAMGAADSVESVGVVKMDRIKAVARLGDE